MRVWSHAKHLTESLHACYIPIRGNSIFQSVPRKSAVFDPTIGRWQTKDPKSFDAGDTNLYRYVGDHPSYATDPSGLEEFDAVLFNEFLSSIDPYAAFAFNQYAQIGQFRRGLGGWMRGLEIYESGNVEDDNLKFMVPDHLSEYQAAQVIAKHIQSSWFGAAARKYQEQIILESEYGYSRWRQTVQQRSTLAARIGTEAYLSFLSITNEGTDLVVTVSDLADGNYMSAIGLLPFVSNGGIKFVDELGNAKYLDNSQANSAVAASFAGDVGKIRKIVENAPKGTVWANGVTGLADDLAKHAGNITPKSGLTDVFIHSTSDSFHVLHNGSWIKLSHRDIANFLKSKGVSGDLRLISCDAGQGQLAQNLANKLGVTVEAATTKVGVPIDFKSAPLLEPGGIWIPFKPGGGR
jgi:hypothetical protein